MGGRPQTRSERGVALPVALSVLFVTSTLVAAGAMAAVAANGTSQRERDSKRAIAAADAGVDAALYRLNTVAPGPSQCAVWDGTTYIAGPPDPDGWCPAHEEELVEGERFAVRTSTATAADVTCQSARERRIVSTGIAGSVMRRVVASVSTVTGDIFSSCALISWQKFTAEDNARLRGDVATNGEAALRNASYVCGDVYAATLTQGPNAVIECGQAHEHTAGATPYKLRKVQLPDCLDTPTSQGGCNDNERITSGDDPRVNESGNPADFQWDPDARTLEMTTAGSNTTQLTLTGNSYSLCYLRLANQARIVVAPRIPNSVVRIFMDSPESCPGQPASRTTFLKVESGGATILNTNPDPTTLQIYMVGTFDPGRRFGTKIRIANNPLGRYMNAVIYAPRSRVSLANKTRIFGAVAAKRVSMALQARVVWGRDVTKLDGSNFSVAPSYTVDSWAECSPPAVQVPASPAPAELIAGCGQ